MKKIYLILLSSLSTFLQAQTILGTDINSVAGDNFSITTSAWINPGGSGANQTWNLSTMTNTGQQTVSNSSSTIPGANIQQVWSTGVTMHLNLNSTQHDVVRQIAQGVTISFSNPWTMYGFPLSLNASGTDNYSASFTSQGTTFQRNGTTTWTVDGSGTLTTPSGTFNNVLRIKIENDFTDVTSGFEIEYSQEIYLWVKAGYRHWLAQVEDTQSDFGGGSAGSYLNTLGLSVPESVISFNIFPNPSSDYISIQSQNIDLVQAAQIFDMSGKLLFEAITSQIDISELSEGVYMLVLLDAQNAILTRQKFVKK
jgi:hypothetical protein